MEETGRLQSIQGTLHFLSDEGNDKVKRVQIKALNDKTNRNNWRYVNLEKHLSEFKDIPVLTAYTKKGDGIGDGHNFDMQIDSETGEEYASFVSETAERIVGWTIGEPWIETDTDGVQWVVVDAGLWLWYARELVGKIVRQGNDAPMDVSVETYILNEHTEGDVEVEDEYVVLGITILGNGVRPAVAGANIKSLAELSGLRSSMKDKVLKAASYIENKQNNKGVNTGMNFSVKQMKALSNEFPGYKCVGVSQNGKAIALLSENNTPAMYIRLDSDNGAVAAERIREVAAELTFKADDEEIGASLDAVIDTMAERLNESEARKEALEKENKELKDRVEKMEAAEDERRIKDAKDIVACEFDRINKTRDDEHKLGEDFRKELTERIEKDEFTHLVDKDNNWIGGDSVRHAISDWYLKADMEQREEAYKRDEKRFLSWNKMMNNNAGAKPKTIGEALSMRK